MSTAPPAASEAASEASQEKVGLKYGAGWIEVWCGGGVRVGGEPSELQEGGEQSEPQGGCFVCLVGSELSEYQGSCFVSPNLTCGISHTISERAHNEVHCEGGVKRLIGEYSESRYDVLRSPFSPMPSLMKKPPPLFPFPSLYEMPKIGGVVRKGSEASYDAETIIIQICAHLLAIICGGL